VERDCDIAAKSSVRWENNVLTMFRTVVLAAFLIGSAAIASPLNSPNLEDARQDTPLPANISEDVASLIRIRDYHAAEELLIGRIEANPKQPALLRALGGVFFLDGQYLNCASALEKAKAAHVIDEPSQFTLAMAYVKLGRNDWAQMELDALVKTDPKRALYRYWSGRIDFADQQFQAAVQKLKVAIELDPGLVKAYDSLALSYEALGETHEAVRTFEAAIERNRSSVHPSPWPALDFGELLFELGRYEEAKSYLQESLRYTPELPQAHYKLGLVYEKLGTNQTAVAELQKAVSLNRSYPEPYYALSRIYRRQGEEELAQQAANRFELLNKRQ
jgi:tetratricopeptide (TPR) repeat protein